MSDKSKGGRGGATLRRAGARFWSALRDIGLPVPVRVKVIYSPEYIFPYRWGGSRRSLDVRRPARVAEGLQADGVLGRSRWMAPVEQAAREDLLRVHDASFLDEVASPERVAALLHLEPGILPNDVSLAPFLWQAAGTNLALEVALQENLTVINLGGGFHHARRDRAEGYCPINDIAVAIQRARAMELGRRFLVVDLDYHQGQGTALIFADDPDVFTLSLHGKTLARVEGKCNNLDVELPRGMGNAAYLKLAGRALETALTDFHPDAVIYVAGGDVHADDMVGDFALSDGGVLRRDLQVWSAAREGNLPLAVVLAGGYGPLAWTLPYNFIYSLATGAPIHPALRPSNVGEVYRSVGRALTREELRVGADELDSESIEEMLGRRCGSGLFMDAYTTEGLRRALERFGFLDLLRDKGFADLRLSTRTDDPDRQMTRIHFGQEDPGHLLVELVVRFFTLVSPEVAVEQGAEPSYRVLSIEWLLMQDPTAAFTDERPPLPGQDHPGLGLGRFTVELLRLMAEGLNLCGLSNNPQHYHNAYLYSKQMLCFDPEQQGRLEAMKRDLGRLPLVEASRAVDAGRLRDAETGEQVSWSGPVQVMPVSPALNSYFARPGYIREVNEARERSSFELALR